MDNKFGSSTMICRQWSHTYSHTQSLPSQRLALVSRSQINIRHNLTYHQCPLQHHHPSLTSTHPTWITARANTPTCHPTPPPCLLAYVPPLPTTSTSHPAPSYNSSGNEMSYDGLQSGRISQGSCSHSPPFRVSVPERPQKSHMEQVIIKQMRVCIRGTSGFLLLRAYVMVW